MDRRTAGKTLGFGFMGASLYSSFQLNKRSLGVALVGLGNYATHQLAPALQLTSGCHLAGLVSGTPTKLEKWTEQYQIDKKHCYSYDTFDQIRDDPAIDIVYIVLPNFLHAEYTIRALELGKHVICEKPMGMNEDECRQMLTARDSSGKKLQVGYRLYYEPHHSWMHNSGRDKSFGNLKMMESSLGFRMATPGSWRIDLNKGGGGAIMDLGVYCIQAARRMANELPTQVVAQGYNTDSSLFDGIYEHVTFQMKFSSGAMSNSTTSFNAYVDRFHAACLDGWLTLNPSFNAGQPVGLSCSREIGEELVSPQFQQVAQMDAFAQNILEDTKVMASGEEGQIDMRIIDAIKMSLEHQEAVTLNWG